MCEIWRRFQRHSTLRRQSVKMQQDFPTPKQTSTVVMIALSSPSLVKLGQRTPENRWAEMLKIARGKRAKSS